MSNKLNKESNKESKGFNIWFNIIGAIMILALVVVAVYLYKDTTKDSIPGAMTKELLQTKVKEAINAYDYADVQWNSCILDSNNQVKYMSDYNLYTTGREVGSWKTYSLYNYEQGVSSRISWKSPINGEPGEVYAYDSMLGVYVADTTTEDIVNMDPWNIVDDLSMYSLEDKIVDLEGISCYLLYYMVQDDDGAITTDEVYIDAETFLPILIMVSSDISSTMKEEAISNIDEISSEYRDALEDAGITSVEDITGAINSYNNFVMMYSFGYYDEDAATFTVPDDYVTVEEWNDLYEEYLNSLPEEDNNESSEESVTE